ncbi:MAG: hypothetical protein ACXVLQ_00960 [Bacteriovorax sp.]
MKYLMLLSVLFAFNVKAEITADDLALADEAIQSPTMNIEGQYQVKEETPAPLAVKEEKVAAPKKAEKKLSASDKLRLYRERLEERNRIMVEKKMEQIRYQQELALARKLEQSMNQTLKAIDSVKN